MIRGNSAGGGSLLEPSYGRWAYEALVFQIDPDATQSPDYPLQLEASPVVAGGLSSLRAMVGVGK